MLLRILRRVLVTNTERILALLIRVLRPDVICDIGSHDGRHAKWLRRCCPKSRILAFEPNRRNRESMSRDVGLRGAGIELYACAVGDENRTTDFHVVTGPDEQADTWSRLGSTRVRTTVHAPWSGTFTMQTEPVTMVRLDSILAGSSGSIALWIDVEGGAYDVLRGGQGVLDSVRVVHVEVEMTELWAGQKTAPDVLDYLEKHNFQLVARKPGEFQRDLLFLRMKPFRVSTFAAVLMLLSIRVLLPVWRAIRHQRQLSSSATRKASDASRVT